MTYTQRDLEQALKIILTPSECASLRVHGVKLKLMCNIACYEVVTQRLDTSTWEVGILSEVMKDLLNDNEFKFEENHEGL